MNVLALAVGVSAILITNSLFALWMTWGDLSDRVTLTSRGKSYVDGTFAFTSVTLLLAFIGIIGYIGTEGL